MANVEEFKYEYCCQECGQKGRQGSVVEVDAMWREHMWKVHQQKVEPLSGDSSLRRVGLEKRDSDILGQKNGEGN